MSGFAGTGALLRLAVRRERRIAPWWWLGFVVMALVLVSYIERNMPTPAVKAAFTEAINQNAFFRALGGSKVVPDLGVLSTFRSGGFIYVMNGLAALFAVVRYTRADEDAGRTELLRAGVVSRYAPLTSALVVTGTVSLVSGVLVSLALVFVGLNPVGALAYGAGIGAAGLVFAGVGAVAGQLARDARTARAIGLSVLGVAYLLRYTGDATGQYWMKYVSPIGWSHLVEPFLSDWWAILVVPIVVTVVLLGAAFVLLERRDLGDGLLAEPRGPATAPQLRGPVSLAWRLHRGLLVKWAIGIGVFAVAAGGLSTMVHQLAALPDRVVNLMLRNFGNLSVGVVDAALWPLILIFAHVIALYPVLMVQRLRAEETSGRAEIVQATSATRLRWAFGQLVVGGLGTVVLLAVAGGAFGLTFALLVTGDPAGDAPRVLLGALSTVPAAWLLGALCVLAYGLVPRACVPISWGVWTLAAAAGQILGPFYGVWGGTPFEPFHYIPNIVTGNPFDPTPALVLLALSALLAGGGMLALGRRDFG